jgi:RNA polymerase sigma factor (sigma-70 family)
MSTRTLPSEALPDDAQLVARCRAGDASAWALLVQRYQRLVFAIVRRIGLDGQAAADVLQAVFTRLFEHLARIEDPSRLQAWIVTSAKREALRQRQLAMRSVSISGDEEDSEGDARPWDLPDPAPLAEDALDHLQQLNQLRNGMERLDERCQRLLMLTFRDEEEALSYQEVATRMGVPVGSLGPTRARCLDKLRRLVTEK